MSLTECSVQKPDTLATRAAARPGRLGVQWREPEREKDLVWTPDRARGKCSDRCSPRGCGHEGAGWGRRRHGRPASRADAARGAGSDPGAGLPRNPDRRRRGACRNQPRAGHLLLQDQGSAAHGSDQVLQDNWYAAGTRRVAAIPTAAGRIEELVTMSCLPEADAELSTSWVLWLDLWAQSARHPEVASVRQNSDERWRETICSDRKSTRLNS